MADAADQAGPVDRRHRARASATRCARSAWPDRQVGERTDDEHTRGLLAQGRALVEVEGPGRAPDGTDRTRGVGLHNLKPAPGSRKTAQAGRPRRRARAYGKTSGRGHKGAGARSGNKRKTGYEGGQNPIHMRMRKLRGPHKKMSMPFEQFRTHTQPVNLADLEERFDGRRRGHARVAARPPAWRRARHPVKILGNGELIQEADRQGARLQRQGRGEDRGRRRHRRESIDSLSADADRDHRQRLQRPGDPAQARLHGGDPGALPARRLHPGPRDRRRARVKRHPGQLRRLQHPRLPEPVLAAAASRACRCSRSGSCPTSPPRSSCSCSPSSCRRWRSSQKEGEVGQQKITQYTRYLTVLLAVAAVARLRLPLPTSFGSSGESVVGDADRSPS